MNYKMSLLFLVIFFYNLSAFNQIAPGLGYKHLITENPAQSIHLITVNPDKLHIKIGIANNKCASAQTTLEIAKKQGALAAINGGYFDFGCKNKIQEAIIKIMDCCGYSRYKAFPLWTLCKNKNYYATSAHFTGALCWDTYDQIPLFNAIKTDITLEINGITYNVCDLNKPNLKGPLIYFPSYDKKTPSFDQLVDEIVIENGKVEKICKSSRGSKIIPSNGYIYVVPQADKQTLDQIKLNDQALVRFSNKQKQSSPLISDSEWDKKDNILASTPLLICNSTILEQLHSYQSAFYTKRHPRSAVGFLKNGNWIFVVADGRAKHAEGFTIVELAQFMQKLGCVGALNLDGGGSSTMVIKDTIINSPSGRRYTLAKKERDISNAFLICSK